MGRPLAYGVEKKERKVRVTDDGWQGARLAAQRSGYLGVSEILEEFGRGSLTLTTPPKPPDREGAIAQVLRTIPPRDRASVSRHLRKLVNLL
jgi:hypothetical protein